MNVILKIAFNSISGAEFTIENPPVLPVEGEIISFEWEEYITDPDELKKLYEFEENNIWMANVISRHYSKKSVLVVVVLFEENHYKQFRSGKSGIVQ